MLYLVEKKNYFNLLLFEKFVKLQDLIMFFSSVIFIPIIICIEIFKDEQITSIELNSKSFFECNILLLLLSS